MIVVGSSGGDNAGQANPKKRKLRQPRAARACTFCRRYAISIQPYYICGTVLLSYLAIAVLCAACTRGNLTNWNGKEEGSVLWDPSMRVLPERGGALRL